MVALEVTEEGVWRKIEAFFRVFVFERISRSANVVVVHRRMNHLLAFDFKSRYGFLGLGRHVFDVSPDAIEKFRCLHTHFQNVVHCLFLCIGGWHNMIFQLQCGFLSLTFRDFRLLYCVRFCILRFVFEQSYRVANGMSDFLMGKDVIELEPSLRFVVQLGKSDSGGSDFLEDVVDHSDFLWSASCIPVWFEIGTDYSSKVSVALVVRKNVSTSAENIGGSRREVERKY